MSKNNHSQFIQQLVVGAVFGALTFAVVFLLGFAITASLGPGTSGIITVIISTMIVVCGGLIVPRFGTFLIINVVFASLAIFTSLFGPIGFLKIAIGVVTGLIYEFFFKSSKISTRKKAMLAGFFAAFSSVYLIYFLTGFYENAVSETLAKYLHYFAFIYGLLGAVGGYLGEFVYEKYISKMPATKKIQENLS